MKQSTDMNILIEDIVKSKGYNVWKNWKNPKLGKKNSIPNLVDSINDKLKPKENVLIENEIKETANNGFKQLEFKF